MLRDYITTQLQLGFEPGHMEALRKHRVEIAGHHQRLLEHASVDKLDRLGGAMKWIEMNLGPWPIESRPPRRERRTLNKNAHPRLPDSHAPRSPTCGQRAAARRGCSRSRCRRVWPDCGRTGNFAPEWAAARAEQPHWAKFHMSKAGVISSPARGKFGRRRQDASCSRPIAADEMPSFLYAFSSAEIAFKDRPGEFGPLCRGRRAPLRSAEAPGYD